MLRVLLLALTLAAPAWFWLKQGNLAAAMVLLLLALVQVLALVHYVDASNRELARFFDSVRYADFTRKMAPPFGDSGFHELNAALNDVVEQIRQYREEKEEQYRYLQTIVQHIGIGLIVFDDTGKVDLVNNAARRILNMSNIRDISKLRKLDPGLAERITGLAHGQRTILKIRINEQLQQMMMFVTDFVMRGSNYRLISFQNIQSELEEKELEAWQSLIRVLTHEIMNSITPISSLAATANSLLETRIAERPEEDENLEDVSQAVRTIEGRSKGLLHFVENYRQLTRIPKPDYKILPVSDVFDNVLQLFKYEMGQQNIRYTTEINPEALEITADPDLVQQVMINLVKNAVEAAAGQANGRIRLTAFLDAWGKPVIEIRDNGAGIAPEVIDNIFIPFFTTKANGSGIGLSLCRQIMRVHGGGITARSSGGETVFQLRWG